MSTILRTLMLSVVALTALNGATRGDDTATKILLIGHKLDHPWGSHMYLHTHEMLSKCLRQTKGVDTVISDRWPRDQAVLDGVKTIVVYSSPGAELLLDGPQGDEVDKVLRQGVGLTTIHWASSIHKKNLDRLGERWIHYLGGTWVSNVGLSTDRSPLKQLIPDHPVCRGWSQYELHDEFYLNPTISQAKPLLQVTTKGNKVIVGWVHERADGGRAFGTTLGHYYRNFQIDAFRRMIVNGILWTAKVELPKDGAPIALSEKDLALPPKP
ncbi:MAG: ThuA domain-containing protein [Pirellulales bacterium]